MSRNVTYIKGELYHCYNRGVDKRNVFLDAQDFDYFLKALELFNRRTPRGGMMEYQYPSNSNSFSNDATPLVKIISYCLNSNHYHLLLSNNLEDGVSKFMHRVGTGYTNYFNKKYQRSGTLFQGRYKSVHVDTDIYLKHLLVYVSLNNNVHGITEENFYRSSCDLSGDSLCEEGRSIVKDLFGTLSHFKKYAEKEICQIIDARRGVSGKSSPDPRHLE